MTTGSNEHDFEDVLARLVEGQLTADEHAWLQATLLADAAARAHYRRYIRIHSLLHLRLAAPDDAPVGDRRLTEKSEVGGRKSVEKPARPTRPPKSPPAPIPDSPILNPQSSILNVLRHPATFWSLLGFVVVGMLGIVYWATTSHGPGPLATAPSSAAMLVRATDAKWQDDIAPTGDALAPGQRLKLNSGSAEITFNRQARVILQGPAEFTIVDATACRLSNGRLTAQVPEPAHGFKVHTPDGTVTDLGTEFGVFVKAESGEPKADELKEQQLSGKQQDDKRPPVTEVHVFKGKVDITDEGDRLAQSPTPPQSPIPNRKSQILSAGEAVTISENKVTPLPAADPFTFALDKLQGKPRTVLLTDDFETYGETYSGGERNKAIGPWTVQSGIRKGQGICVYDPRAKLAEMTNDAANPVANLSPPPPIGSRVAYIGAAGQNPKNTYPLLAREIDGKLLTKNCQVLVEFDYMPLGPGAQFSVALAAEAGHCGGIELWRDAGGKVIDCPGYQWYRLRVLVDVAAGVAREVRAERSHWLGPQGWQRDLTFQPPTPQLDWSTPPRYAMFGFPVVSPTTPAGVFLLDNVRIEVIAK
ncbi:MAG: FecR family protein [Planctomycetia bacterium]|nr:FecR family protein [Planctomycetia bacterium]